MEVPKVVPVASPSLAGATSSRSASPQRHASESQLGLASTPSPPRGRWSNQLEFTITIIGYAVGLGNFWRFPYLWYACIGPAARSTLLSTPLAHHPLATRVTHAHPFNPPPPTHPTALRSYKHGGGAFLLPYTLCLFLMGMPIFLLELALGQKSQLGARELWASVHPAFGGLGIAAVLVTFSVALYYNVIVAWTLWYLGNSFAWPLPWSEERGGALHFWEVAIESTAAYCDSSIAAPLRSSSALLFRRRRFAADQIHHSVRRSHAPFLRHL